MSRYIATAAIRGANAIVKEAEEMLARAIAELGPDAPVAFPNTAYYLPVIYGFTGIQVTKLSDLIPVLQHARSLLHPVPTDKTWLPYLGETLDCGVATLLAEEAIEGIRFARGEQPERIPGLVLTGTSFTSPDMVASGEAGGYANGPIDDIQLRAWGIQLVDGRMPGFAAIVGAAKSNEVAVEIVRQLQQRNILVFLSGNVNGRSIIHQLMEEGVELGYDTYTVPFGTDTISAIYALGFATRSALTFGGMKGGQAREILLYNKYRVFAFVLALGEVDDLKYATAAGAISYGFPTIADTVIPQILPTGITQYEHVISMPFDDIPGENDLERARKLVQKCIEVRGVKVKIAEVPIPVPYGSAFEGERVRREDMRVEFGGKYSRCFEYLRMVGLEECEDGKVTVVGPGIETVPEGGSMDMGILVEVAGRKMQLDFEPVLERQIHYFINGASGIQHIGQRDIAWIRISKAAFEKGFNLEHFGKILHARFHSDFGAIVDKVQVTIFTDKALIEEWLARAREAYNYRNQRLADLVDEAVEEFYSCTLCQSFAPNHVCIISPERLGLCGAYNWLDCKASHQINPTGPNQPVPKGRCLDPAKGYFEKVNEFVYHTSHNTVQQVSMYSIIENPMTACFTRDTEVIIDGRPVAIGDFVDRHIQETFHYASALTQGPDGQVCYDRIVGMHKNPAPARLIRLLTRTGDELLLTPNHPVAVDRPEGQVWVRADQVQVGDRVYALRHLRLPERRPSAIDLLPDDVGVAEPTFLERLEERLRRRFGSLAAACRAARVKRPSFGDHAWPLGTVKALVAALGEDWNQVQGEIRQVRIGPSTWSLPELDERFFYLLGLLASDGSISRRGRHECFINFVNTDPALLEAFEGVYKAVFPGRSLGRMEKPAGRSDIPGMVIRSTRRCFNLYGANPLLGMLAESFGVKMAGAGRWDLGRMLSLPAEWIAAFLAGCFDGDGSIRLRRQNGRWISGEAYLGIDDLRAARHLKLLLKRLGIVADLRRSGPVYKLLLHGRSLRRFAETVPTQHPQKAGWLQEILKRAPALDKSLEEVLPYRAGQVLASIPAASRCLPPSTLYHYRTARSRPVAGNVRRVWQADPAAAEVLKPFLEGDTFLDAIVRAEVIENGHEHDFVYNLTLMDIHSYYANHVWVKNCGCFECIAMLIPEANGIMVVSREDPSMTPAGMTFSTLAGMAGGGLQTPGVMGVGKYYLLSKKFISADGGFKRVVWMSSILKETMAEELKQVAIREGDPDLIDKIADERVATTVEELLAYLEEKGHPALTMPPIF
ncbi:MAG: LAGLIDADG family homing endonuclease [Chloroflexia bacterium]